MGMNIPFTPGQRFVAADPRDEGRTLQIISHYPGHNPWVGTLGADGKVRRQRYVDAAQFHDSATTKTGAPRVTGYILEGSE